jgi:hypothetical protein
MAEHGTQGLLPSAAHLPLQMQRINSARAAVQVRPPRQDTVRLSILMLICFVP